MIATVSLMLAVAMAAPPPASPRPRLKASPLAPESTMQADQGPLEALFETSEGPFVIKLLPELAPRHVAHFVKTARKGGYDGTTFHRIVPTA